MGTLGDRILPREQLVAGIEEFQVTKQRLQVGDNFLGSGRDPCLCNCGILITPKGAVDLKAAIGVTLSIGNERWISVSFGEFQNDPRVVLGEQQPQISRRNMMQRTRL